MHQDSLRPLCSELLERLSVEENLLRAALNCLIDFHEALRSGNVAASADLQDRQTSLAEALTEEATRRDKTVAELAQATGLSLPTTLSAITAKLDAADGLRLTAARDRLTGLATEMIELRERNANLLRHLRSYFHSVLSTYSAGEVPVRYGRSGIFTNTTTGTAFQAEG